MVGPAELRGQAGVLETTLVARAGKIHLGDLDLDGATYNGLYAGPVLRVHPGDMLRILLVNHLAQPTNLHFHGIQTSPLGNSDNVHISVPPGASFTYEVRIPATQPPGLYWYHSHVHGLSEQQVMGGLSGALVVEEAPSPDQAAPARAAMAERLFVLKDMTFDDDTGNSEIDEDLHGLIQSINGNIDTNEMMHPGETQFWRFSNQSADRAFHIALEGHRFRVRALDGESVIGERWEDILDIMPASRVEVEVEGGAPGRYALLSKGAMTGTGAERRPDRVLGHLDVAGAPIDAPRSAVTAVAPPDLRDAGVDTRRTIVFAQTNTLDPEKQRFFINGRTFDPGRVDFRVPLGAVEEWTVRNNSDDLHVFHIHQLGFQVVEVNGKKVAFTGRVDTVRVPERGEVILRMAFADPLILGRFMFHCHVLKHEDRGMMGQIEVFDSRPSSVVARLWTLYFHVWWWIHGVPWTLCGLSHA